VLNFLNQPEKVGLLNVRPFKEMLGPDIISFYSSARSSQTNEEVMKLAQVARQLHMTTDVRHNVFYAVTTSVDVIDAFTKVTKLKLSKTQRKDVPLIIIECCRKESSYNPFYAALAEHFREFEKGFDRNLRSALKNTIKLMPGMSVQQLRNAALFAADLIEKGVLNLRFLKNVKLMKLVGQGVLFVNVLLREVFQKWEREEVIREMGKIRGMPNFSEDFRKFLEGRFLPFVEGQSGMMNERKSLVRKAIDTLRTIG
jgi:nucleolar MIF4G domain-containing protein 1